MLNWIPSRLLIRRYFIFGFVAIVLATRARAANEPFGPNHLTPNLVDNIERPLRYRPDGSDFVIENGREFFNRSLYGGNTAFRVDAGDRPEFVLYLPGRGGNLRFALRRGSTTKWLHDASRIVARYRPGQMLYEIEDPLLGTAATLQLSVLAYAETDGVIIRVFLAATHETNGTGNPLELLWSYGGLNGQRGKRDGDIGTESVPISEWFQLRPEFCAGNAIAFGGEGFTLQAKAATIAGIAPGGAQLAIGDAGAWDDPATLFSHSSNAMPQWPVLVGHVSLTTGAEIFLSLQRINSDGGGESARERDLDTYREVSAPRSTASHTASTPASSLAAVFARQELPARYREAERYFRELRQRISVDTPDPFLNAAVGALNVAADAVWDEPQQAIMHGAIAWRTKLLGWRGPYALDALGRHERARTHFTSWASHQNTDPVPSQLPPADEAANLARNEAGLHSNGDLSNSHYDMNLVYIDALFRHLAWTGDLTFAEKMWPVIERHLAWERRMFRREFGPEKLPLYEAYAAIWASDDLQYSGGGATHSSAYNYFHNVQAARLARLLGRDATPYAHEAELLAHGMRWLLWLPDGGGFAESKDLLGLQRVHPSAGLWTFYHAMDSELPTAAEALQMTRRIESEIPHLPVRGPGVPAGLYVLATTHWMPYQWSINNVVFAENVHTALGFWQAGRPDEAWRIARSSLLAAMFMGISPGNVGSMSYLDVYRRESQRDFADGSGVFSRALVEGLFGLKPDALAGELRVTPGFPSEWNHANLRHPDLSLRFEREGDTDHYVITQRFALPQSLRFQVRAHGARVRSVAVNGDAADWHLDNSGALGPQLVITSPPGFRHEVLVQWSGEAPPDQAERVDAETPHSRDATAALVSLSHLDLPADVKFECVDLSAHFNDRVAQIFKNEYRSPRSPFVSLALPKQGIGGWAGGVNATAEIDDSGLRASAARQNGRITLPSGVPLATPGTHDSRNIVFTSLWDNYPNEVAIPLSGHANGVFLLMAGSTNPMQSRFENGEVVVTYMDGTTARLPLENPTTWWPIEQDYFVDDFQFRRPEPLPIRIDLKTGLVRELEFPSFKGQGGRVSGGAATVLALPLDSKKELKSLAVRALANDVVVGLMSVTLAR